MGSAANFKFCIEAFDSFIQIECGDAEILDMLDRYIFPAVPRIGSAPSSATIHLRVEKSSRGFRVLLDQKLVASANSIHDAALAAVKALDDAVVPPMEALRAVHAGAVLIEGKAVIVAGSSHAGKSTLVAELLRRGASCFSDEYALIDREGQVHCYSRPLLLRNGSPHQSLVLPGELNASYAILPAPVGWILGLDYVPGGTWEMRKVAQGEAVMLLLRNTPHELAQTPEVVDFFLRVAANAECYAGQRGDVAEAAGRILELVGQK